jgi:mannose-1-phosphate guanylyltransferase
MYAIIMAGGGGTRLWPKSRIHSPKQLHSFVSNQTLLEETIERIESIIDRQKIYIVTNKNYFPKIKEQIPGIPDENYVLERFPWGTILGAIIAVFKIKKIEENPAILFCWCDHYIKNKTKLLSLLKIGERIAKKGYLVTLGVKPSYPSTGLGYIKVNDVLERFGKQKVYRIDRFIEKPTLTRAKKYLASFDYLWNTGIFVFTADKIWELFKKHLPKHAKAVEKVQKFIGKKTEEARLNSAFKKLSVETIDKGISEKTKEMAVIPADIGWSDIGDWQVLKSVLKSDKNGNIIKGSHIGIATRDSLVFGGRRLIATLGVEDLIVVDTDDALFVADGKRTQEIRQLIEALQKERKEYL